MKRYKVSKEKASTSTHPDDTVEIIALLNNPRYFDKELSAGRTRTYEKNWLSVILMI